MVVDTLKLYERFRKAELPEAASREIAEAFKEAGDAFTSELATKKDLELTELALRREIAEARASVIIWVAGMLVAQAGLIAALVKLL